MYDSPEETDMSRKDYVLLANAINYEFRRTTTIDGQTAICNVVYEIGTALKNDNERFDRDKFYNACTDRS